MLEWLKRHAWKACNRPKRFRGSNPRLSARISDGVQSVKGESPSLRKDLDFCCKNRNFVVSFRARNDRSTSDLPPTYLRLTSDLPPTYRVGIWADYSRQRGEGNPKECFSPRDVFTNMAKVQVISGNGEER